MHLVDEIDIDQQAQDDEALRGALRGEPTEELVGDGGQSGPALPPTLMGDALDQHPAVPVSPQRHVQDPEAGHREQQRRTAGHSS